MKKQKFTDEQLLAKIQNIFNNSEDAKYIRRLDILNLVLSGISVQQVSQLYNLHRSTIYSWLNKAKSQGLEILKDQPKEGRPSQIMEIELKKIKKDLQKQPEFFGYKNAFWDGKLLSYHLKQKYNIDLGVRQCQRLFHKLNFSPKESEISSA
jgi:transposase